MKALLAIALPAIFLTGCETPAPIVIERNHYYKVTPTPTPRRTYTPQKSSPSINNSGTAEGFRAIERTD